jgi:DNA-binding NarL/FixJ family response regulator
VSETAANRPIRVVLADDQEMVRRGLQVLLDRAPDITVVGEAGHGREAFALARKLLPDVVLMDIRMPFCDGIEATALIRAEPACDSVRVIMLTTFDSDDNLFSALAAGAAGFLTKDVEPLELRRALRTVAAGQALLSPTVTMRVIRRATAGRAPDPRAQRTLEQLTEREREVLAQVALGRTNDEVAEELVVSPATARTYVHRLLTKLGARDRVALVVLAHRAGIV